MTPEQSRHALIVANGAAPDYAQCRRLAAACDLVIAANGGARRAQQAGITPQVVIGDLDSLDDAFVDRLRAAGSEVIHHPARKDETDLELALRYAVEHQAIQITLVGVLGRRLDQSIANLLLLSLPELAHIEVHVVDGNTHAWVVRDQTTIAGRPGDTVSLIPLTDRVTGITTSGLEYPLEEGTLYFGRTRGISNVLTEPTAQVRIGSGLLLLVHLSVTDSVLEEV